MKIVLRINKEDKTFVNDFIPAICYKDALLIHRKIEANPEEIKDEELLDDLVPFIVSVFDHQFTVDEVWKGIRYNKIFEEAQRIFHTVLGLLNEEDEEGNEAGK